MKKHAVFLDIDGTLVNFDGTIPKSTIEALQRARENGHQLVICTGRSRFQISKALLSYGFDGIVCAAGACVEHCGHEVFHTYIPEEKRRELTEFLTKENITFDMQAANGIVLNNFSKRGLIQHFEQLGMDEDRFKWVVGKMEVRDDVWNNPFEEKAVYYDAPFSLSEMQEKIGPYFQVVGFSFENSDGFSGEIGIAGVTKATGMERYLKEIGLSREDSIGIGDGPNDFEMVEYAGVGVAMGNAIPELKEKADYVTSRITEDGIANAFAHLGLI